MKRICTILLALFATSAVAEEQWTNIYDATLCESIINYDLVFNENSDFEEFQRKFDAKDAYSNFPKHTQHCLLYTSPSPRDS